MTIESKNIRAVFSDFDATLCDSLEHNRHTVTCMFKSRSLPVPTELDFRTNFRPPFKVFYHSRGLTLPEDELQELFNSFEKHEEFELFADTVEFVRCLKRHDIRLGVISARPPKAIEYHFDKNNISGCFDFVYGSAQMKIGFIRKGCECLGLKPHEVVYVGDSTSDIEAAIGAGVFPVGVARGHHSREDLERVGARFVITHFDELLAALGLKENGHAVSSVIPAVFGQRSPQERFYGYCRENA